VPFLRRVLRDRGGYGGGFLYDGGGLRGVLPADQYCDPLPAGLGGVGGHQRGVGFPGGGGGMAGEGAFFSAFR